jgi:hypothetical protein
METGRNRYVVALLTYFVVRRHPFKKAADGKKNIFFRGKIYETRWSCSIKAVLRDVLNI